MGRLIHRTLSLAVAVFYLLAARRLGGARLVVSTLMFLVLPMTCIWFADYMDEYRGPWGIGTPGVTRPSPPWLVRFLAWGLLLLPVAIGVINELS